MKFIVNLKVLVIFTLVILFYDRFNICLAQTCSKVATEAQLAVIENEIQTYGPVVNSEEADNDLVIFFEIVSSNVTSEEYEIFTMLHTSTRIVYNINGLLPDEMVRISEAACFFQKSKGREIVLRFYPINNNTPIKIVILS